MGNPLIQVESSDDSDGEYDVKPKKRKLEIYAKGYPLEIRDGGERVFNSAIRQLG